MGLPFTALRIAMLFVGLYFAKKVVTLRKEIYQLQVQQAINGSSMAFLQQIEQKKALSSQYMTIATIFLVPIMLYSILTSVFGLAVVIGLIYILYR